MQPCEIAPEPALEARHTAASEAGDHGMVGVHVIIACPVGAGWAPAEAWLLQQLHFNQLPHVLQVQSAIHPPEEVAGPLCAATTRTPAWDVAGGVNLGTYR